MQYNAQNTALWNIVIQFGIIGVSILFANLLRRKIPFFRKSLLPTAVLAGFVLLIARISGLIEMDLEMLEMLTYHGIAIGFIAMSLRVTEKQAGHVKDSLAGVKSGALIVSCYLIQGVIGLVISLALAYTVKPDLFKAAGILLPMGYGQGPGQANNTGTSYEALGFIGGRSFGLALATAGYLCACIVGVSYLNVLRKRGLVKAGSNASAEQTASSESFENEGEIPVSESLDRFSMQMVLVLSVYLLTYLCCKGIDAGLTAIAPGLGKTLSPILWGFNFIFGSVIATLVRSSFKLFKKAKIMTRQYQNNYLLSRISGAAFDLMIVAGIASINPEDLTGLWLPFALMAIAGGVLTLIYLRWICKYIYKDYYYEGMTSMYGMMTGTISSGVLLLRELDPGFETPAANNLVLGSSFAILFGAPMLLLIGMAPKSDLMTWIVLGLCVIYFALLLLFIFKVKKKGTEK